jgi:hypothetical protein
MAGGSGVDLLIANGDTVPGTPRQLFGDGTLTDGGVRGVDTFRSLDGWSLIQDWQAGERIEVDTLISKSLILNGSTYYLRVVSELSSTGASIGDHETWVSIGTNTSMTQATAASIAGQISANVFVDPNLIA